MCVAYRRRHFSAMSSRMSSPCVAPLSRHLCSVQSEAVEAICWQHDMRGACARHAQPCSLSHRQTLTRLRPQCALTRFTQLILSSPRVQRRSVLQ